MFFPPSRTNFRLVFAPNTTKWPYKHKKCYQLSNAKERERKKKENGKGNGIGPTSFVIKQHTHTHTTPVNGTTPQHQKQSRRCKNRKQ